MSAGLCTHVPDLPLGVRVPNWLRETANPPCNQVQPGQKTGLGTRFGFIMLLGRVKSSEVNISVFYQKEEKGI